MLLTLCTAVPIDESRILKFGVRKRRQSKNNRQCTGGNEC